MIDRLDPLEAAKEIEGSYKRYLKTLLAPRDEKLATSFDAEVDSSDLLTKGPILEMTPPYSTGATCRELIAEGVLHPGFAALDSAALPLDQPLYIHQEKAIRKFDTSDAFLRFEKFESRIDRMEADADLINMGRKPTLDEEISRLADDEGIERELQELKGKQNKG